MAICSAWRRPTIPIAHGQRSRRRPLALLAALSILAMVGASPVRAQTGTPTTGPDAPALKECAVAPRSEDELRALFREAAATPLPTSLEASPTPAVAPMGRPADERTVAEITATWRLYVACLTAGDQARMFALLSDAMVRRQFVVDIAFGVTEDAFFDYLAETPVALAPDQPVPLEPLEDARVLDDGRVAVVGPGDQGRGDVRIFVKDGGRWLIDDWFDLS